MVTALTDSRPAMALGKIRRTPARFAGRAGSQVRMGCSAQSRAACEGFTPAVNGGREDEDLEGCHDACDTHRFLQAAEAFDIFTQTLISRSQLAAVYVESWQSQAHIEVALGNKTMQAQL